MWISKIGGKSSSFLNHKCFHPSNMQNLQRVWMAEEKQLKEEERLKAIIEQREEEKKIQELRRAMHSSKPEANHSPNYINIDEPTKVIKNKRRHIQRYNDGQTEALKRDQRAHHTSRYDEDCYKYNHTSVWGSYFDKSTQKWGYVCCKSSKRQESCLSSEQKDSETDRTSKPSKTEEKMDPKKRKTGEKSFKKMSNTGLAEIIASINKE